MEYGNIGNYYIVEPLIRQLHRTFPKATITTTLQMTKKFQKKENIRCLPIEQYYSWSENDLDVAYKELAIATIFQQTGSLIDSTPFIGQVLKSFLIIDFSGDMWGDNANFAGKNRLLIGLIKDRVAQLLGKKTAMIAGSPGPFNEKSTLNLAKKVYSNFDLVTNREEASTLYLKKKGFDLSKTKSLTCPSFLFNSHDSLKTIKVVKKEKILIEKKPTIGMVISGWNFTQGPYSKENRKDKDFTNFVLLAKHIIKEYKCNLVLLSHNNGFTRKSNKFVLTHGRDYIVVKQLQSILNRQGVSDKIYCLDGIYNPQTTHAIIGQFDMLITGRMHAAIAAISKKIPVLIINYGHGPKAHKIIGIAKTAGIQNYVAEPNSSKELIKKFDKCWSNRKKISAAFDQILPQLQHLAKNNFTELQALVPKKIAIMQPYLFPYIGYFQLINAVDQFVLLDDVQWIKGGWINRNRILLNGEPRMLTLSVCKRSNYDKINTYEIFGNEHNRHHFLNSIKSAYIKAPQYNDVIPLIEKIVLNPENNISKYILYSLIQISKYLEINTPIIISSKIKKNNNLKFKDRVTDICHILKAPIYINPIGGTELYDQKTFQNEGIDLFFIKTKDYRYKQFENSFVANLSIIDVLMFNSKNKIKQLLNNFELIKN